MNYDSENSWVRSALHPGEHLLWTGKPGRGHLLEKQDALAIPFSLIWLAFAVFWELSVLRAGGFLSGNGAQDGSPMRYVLPLFGVPFLLIGLYLFVGRFAVRWIQRRRTCYALTSLRLFRKRGGDVRTADLRTLPALTVRMHGDGSGSIYFGGGEYDARYGAGRANYGRWAAPVFVLENVEDVNNVELQIRNAQTRLRQAEEYR